MKKYKPLTAIVLMVVLFFTISCAENTISNTSIHTRTIEGRVHDRESLQPVKGVLVMSFPSRSKGITGVEGTCTFERPETDTTIVFTKKGYGDVHVPLRSYDEIVGAIFDKK